MALADFKQTNINYWSRIHRGERALMNEGIINRIGNYLPQVKEILTSPLHEVISSPLCPLEKLSAPLKKLEPMFENLLFVKDEKGKALLQKKSYWSYTSFHLMANMNFLAYQLILFRVKSLKQAEKHFYLSLKNTTFLLLRLLMTTPLHKIADTLIREYYYFFLANAQNLELKIPNASEHQVNSSPLFYVIEMCIPEAKHLPHMQNFSAYEVYHEELLEKAQEILFGEWQTTMQTNQTVNQDILYWADHYCDLWLSSKSEKIALYDRENPAFKDIYNAIHYSQGLHRIW